MSMDITWMITVQVPQLDMLQQTLVALIETLEKGFAHMAMQLDELVAAVNAAAAAVAAEIEQAADKLAEISGATEADQRVIDEQVAKLHQITASVQTIVPDEATPPATP